MNAIMYFGSRIFKTLGLRMNVFQTVTNAVNFLSTFPAIYLADRCGRRMLLMLGAVGMAMACAVVGAVGMVFMTRSEKNGEAHWQPTSHTAGLVIAFMLCIFVVSFAASW